MYETDKNQLETQLLGTRNMIAHLQTQIENLTKQNVRLKEELRLLRMENEDLNQYDVRFDCTMHAHLLIMCIDTCRNCFWRMMS